MDLHLYDTECHDTTRHNNIQPFQLISLFIAIVLNLNHHLVYKL
jgi:hypothetical protein